jgi:PAS domain S-box-containing protein
MFFDEMLDGFAYHRIVVDKAGQPIDYVFLEVNHAFEKMTGLKREKIVGKQVTEVLVGIEKDPADWIGVYGKVALTGKPVQFENYNEALCKWFKVVAYCPEKGYFVALFEDITEHKKAEEALKLSEAHYRTLFSGIGEGFELMELLFDENNAVYDLRYLEVNDTYEKQTGLKAKDVLGKTVRELFPKIEGMWIKVFEKVIKTGLPTRLEDYHQATNRYYSAYYFPFGNKKVGVLFSDITERKKAEEALKQRTEQLELTQKKLEENAVQLEEYASQMEELAEQRANQLKDSERLATIGITAGMVGHDIRNPLQAITGDVYLAKTDLASIPESEKKQTIQESLTEIEKNIDYINKIVADLQDFARPLKPNAEETDIKPVIDQLLAKNGLPENVKVSVKVESGARLFVADSTFINRIMYNLVNNAVQAMPKGGQLTIHAYKEAKDVVISVKDTGVGIPEAVKSKLFTPMFTTKAKGQGFGLPVIKRMTEALGGTVTFVSQEGKGTTFIVRLPPQRAKR